MTLSPKESGKVIADLAEHIKINDNGIKKLGDVLVKEINSGRLTPDNFSQNEFHPNADDPWALEWIFVVDTLNFCFWRPENAEGWVVDGKSGYFALCNAVNRAIKEKVDILNPRFYSTITEEQLSKVLRSDTRAPVPLLSDRLKSLHEVGTCLLEKFDGSFENCVKQANNSAVELVKIVIDNFKCYRDEATYKGHKVSLYKRAQILVGDIWACFKGRGIGHFEDIDEITMFADYRVPQSLLYHNAFEYSNELMETLETNPHLKNGSEMEVEIRGCSIHAVTLLNEYVKTRVVPGKIVNPILIDHFLWDFRRKHAREIVDKKLPFHKTFCIYY